MEASVSLWKHWNYDQHFLTFRNFAYNFLRMTSGKNCRTHFTFCKSNDMIWPRKSNLESELKQSIYVSKFFQTAWMLNFQFEFNKSVISENKKLTRISFEYLNSIWIGTKTETVTSLSIKTTGYALTPWGLDKCRLSSGAPFRPERTQLNCE